MSTIFNLLREINNNSPFLWEVRTEGWSYSILCDGKVAEDPETGDMTEDSCVETLKEILRDVISLDDWRRRNGRCRKGGQE